MKAEIDQYSRILEFGKRPADRRRLVETLNQQPPLSDERVEPEEYHEILAEAVTRRNGWNAILEQCSD